MITETTKERATEIKETFKAVYPLLRKLPLADRLEVDRKMAEALGHEPKKLLRKPALRLFEKELGGRNYFMLEKIAKAYGIEGADAKAAALKAYEKRMGDGMHLDAPGIAEKYGLAADETRLANLKAYEKLMGEGKYMNAAFIAEKCCLGEEKAKAAKVIGEMIQQWNTTGGV